MSFIPSTTTKKTTYTPDTVKSMIQSLATGTIPTTGVNKMAFESFVESLGISLTSLDQQLSALKASNMSKISNHFLENEKHTFHKAITFLGELSFSGTVRPVLSDLEMPFSSTSLAAAKTLTSLALLVEIGGVDAATPSYIELASTGASLSGQSYKYALKLYGDPLYTDETEVLGTVRRFTIRTPYVSTGGSTPVYTPVSTNSYTVYVGQTSTEAQASTTLSVVNGNSPPTTTTSTCFTVQEVTVRYLGGNYKATSVIYYYTA